MAEVLFNTTITTLTDGGPPVVTDFNVAQNIEGNWTLAIRPNDSGPADPTSVKIDRLILGEADELVATVAMTDNQLNLFDQAETFTRLRVTLTPGATAPDGGVDVQLIGNRNQ